MERYIRYNANPIMRHGDDCTVRAISKVMGLPWERVYMDLCLEGLLLYDMPSANHVWNSYLVKRGYRRTGCEPQCTVAEFVRLNPKGKYILALNSHVVAVIDGKYYDSWDSGDEKVYYYWKKGREDVRI